MQKVSQEGFVVVRPGEGKTLPGIIFKISERHTGGTFSIVEHPLPPKVLVPPHVHARHDQITYVIEGEVGIQEGDQVIQATAGTYVHKPRGVPHIFWTPRMEPARIMEITFPGGFEGFFEELGQIFAAGGSPERLRELGERYSTTFLMDRVPELLAKHNLKLMGR